ncbi:MAG: DUF924 family protein [Sulfuricellaceae bacterium]|nr:DUF924 family protein [Sulfuricellaceae bacterium]
MPDADLDKQQVPSFLPSAILDFWYDEEMRNCWFSSTPVLDALIRDRFEEFWQRAAAGELDGWKNSAEACLALVILLDQMPLNMFRGKAESFKTEQQAVSVCKYALAQGFDSLLTVDRRAFLYMPLMHSEDTNDQDLSVSLFESAALADNLRFALHHRELIRKFGRFPHRNRILGRTSTPEEETYLASEGAFTG